MRKYDIFTIRENPVPLKGCVAAFSSFAKIPAPLKGCVAASPFEAT
jgi:hypothetical protein